MTTWVSAAMAIFVGAWVNIGVSYGADDRWLGSAAGAFAAAVIYALWTIAMSFQERKP